MTATDARLTPKQRTVMGYLEQGLKPTAIAKRMKITPSGVHGHIRHIRDAGVTLPGERLADANGSDPVGDHPVAPPPASLTVDGAADSEMTTVIRDRIERTHARAEEIDSEIGELQDRTADLQAKRAELERELELHQQALKIYDH